MNSELNKEQLEQKKQTWSLLRNWFLGAQKRYLEYIGDKEKLSLKELNQRSNEFLEKHLKERERVKDAMKQDKYLVALAWAECKNSFRFYTLFDSFATDINRRGKALTQPVIVYPHQEGLCHKLQYGNNLHVEKSRRQGASLFCGVLFPSWLLIFFQDVHCFTTHKDKSSLDKGGDRVNTTFGKIRNNLEKSFFKEYILITKNKEKELVIGNSSLTGAVLNPNTTVGFQANVTMIDEIDPVCDMYPNRSEHIFGAFSTSSNRIFLYSTYRSIKYKFYQIKETKDDETWDFITLDWKNHPLCNEEWYRIMCSKMGHDKVLIARELDHDPTKSIMGAAFDKLKEEHFRPIDKFDYSGWDRLIACDFGGGTSATVFILMFYNAVQRKVILYKALKTTVMDETDIRLWIQSQGFGGVVMAGDRSAKSQSTAPKYSWYKLLKKEGFDLKLVNNRDMAYVRSAVNLAFLNNDILVNSEEPNFKDLWTYKFKDQEIEKNDSSHLGDALCYGYRFMFGGLIGQVKSQVEED